MATIGISAPAAEQQTITLAHVTGGQFDIAYNGHHSGAFGYDVAPELLATAIIDLLNHNGFTGLTGEDVAVVRTATGYTIQFLHNLAGHGVAL